MNTTITLALTDLNTIADGSTVTVTAAHGPIFEVTSEDGWGAPSGEPGVYRFALSEHQLDRLRWGRTVTALPVGFDGSVQFTVDALGVTR